MGQELWLDSTEEKRRKCIFRVHTHVDTREYLDGHGGNTIQYNA